MHAVIASSARLPSARDVALPLGRVVALCGVLLVALACGTAGQAHAGDESTGETTEAGRTTTILATPPPLAVLASANSVTARFRVHGPDGEGLRLRAAPGLKASIVGKLPEGAVVALTAGAATEVDGERWLPVKSDQAYGWAAARYLVRVVVLRPAVRQPTANVAFGERVAALAEAAVGQPYRWGGSAPGGFDCSGFVRWAYTQAGRPLPRTIAEQLAAGRHVDRGTLATGDLISFVNTYRAGLSHVGIYLGRDKFVHAADEAQGVTISDLRDDYWKSRFHKAVRLTP